MAWEQSIKELEFRRQCSLRLGGEERIARHHAQGKLTVRERIDSLLDEKSFMEYGQLAGSGKYDADGKLLSVTPAGYVMGLGRIDGRFVALGGEDFTIRGGSGGGLERRKGGQGGFVEDMAKEYRIPLINLIDGVGADVAEVLRSKYKRLPAKDGYERSVELLGMVPVCSAILGSTAGGPAGRAPLSHFSVMVRKSSQFFAAGPPVVQRALGHVLDKEELGGAKVAVDAGGTIDNVAESEEDAFKQIRRFLSYMPANVWELPPRSTPVDPVDRREEELLSIVPESRSRAYNMRKLVNLVVDKDSFFEIQPTFGRTLIVGLARLNGYVVGVIANDPMINAGAPDAGSARKFIHFTELCDMFHIPLVHFCDVPGFMLGLQAESTGTLRFGMASVFATCQATVPRFTVIVRKCYGMAAALHYNNASLRNRMAWPSAEFGSIPIAGGVAASFKREIESAPNPAERLQEIEKELLAYESPFRTAEKFGIEEIIDPRETRMRLCTLVEVAQNSLKTELGRKPRYGVRP